MDRVFMTLAKEQFCPDEIRPNTNAKVDKIREVYDQKFNELIKWFWEEVDQQTSSEEKNVLFEQLDESLKKQITDHYNV